MPEIEIFTDIQPIPDQELVFNSTKKLNSVASTRRSGKTSGIKLYSLIRSLEAKEEAIVMPDYGYCAEMFEDISEIGGEAINFRNQSRLTLKTITGGRTRFYSYEAIKRLRGKKFNHVYFDEFQSYPGDLDELKAIIMPTLADYGGQAWFFGTPKKNTPIEQIHNDTNPLWGHYCMKAVNNPFITPEEIELQRSLLSPKIFMQEWEAQFVDFSGGLWLYDMHDDVFIENYPVDPHARITLCFDFNVSPGTCILKQRIEDTYENGGGIYFFKEFSLEGGTAKVCKEVKKYMDKELYFYKGLYWVTGDSSGNQRDTRGNITDYQIIQKELGIPGVRFIDTRKQNPLLGYSRDVCNTAIYNKVLFIDRKNCPILSKDMYIARPKEGSDELIKDRKDNKLDSFDAFRYGVHADFKSIPEIHSFMLRMYGKSN